MPNPNATGKKAIFGEIAQTKAFRLYSWEIEPVKEFIKKMREEKRAQLKGKTNEK